MPAPPTPTSDDHLAESLRAQRERAVAAEERWQREYDALLADDDTLQEDRDSVRQLLEEARVDRQAAEVAVARLDAGDYGRCAVCGEPIGADRLEAIPGVDTCQRCMT